MLIMYIVAVYVTIGFSFVIGQSCPQCKSNNCNSSGRCIEGCSDGYYSIGERMDCGSLCYERCKRCSRHYDCSECNAGYYGASCQISCSTGCDGNVCDKFSGHCSCKINYIGDFCNNCANGKYGTNCDLSCSIGCLYNSCYRDGRCFCKSWFTGLYCSTCVDGHYGINCESTCPDTCYTCKTSEECYTCKDGFYGVKCEHDCNIGCKDNSCLQGNGECNRGCEDGYYGSFCDICNNGYYKIESTGECGKCQNNCNRCSSLTYCLECNESLWGPTCNLQCPTHCISCWSDQLCSQCSPGFYGTTCTVECPKNCEDKTCWMTNGNCISCISGFTGNTCENNCPLNCASNGCYTDGYCVSCKPGFYGNSCQNECSKCALGTTCQRFDGHCDTKCKDGWSGYNCDHKCEEKCESCDRNSKYICTRCTNGLYGHYNNFPSYFTCNIKCPETCLNNSCDGISGSCVRGCIDGYSGEKCEHPCPFNCLLGQCFSDNGTCSLGCTAGFTGSFCDCPINCECSSGMCSECKKGFANEDKDCACRTDFCEGDDCTSCLNEIFYAADTFCCPCSHTCRNSLCTSDSNCLNGCEAGYYLSDCSKQCREIDRFCLECPSDYTQPGLGCSLCQSGYFPSTYMSSSFNICIECPPNCKSKDCSSTNGTCTLGCKNTTWGDMCEKNCPNKCFQCNRQNGQCEICESGRYKTDCSASCSESCNITHDELLCAIEDGACVNGCTSLTKFGLFCEQLCSENCTNSECERRTGKCHGCVEEHWGDFCEYKCSENCKEVDSSTNCNELDGQCLLSCKDGYYSERCDQTCSINCLNNSCDSTDGKCLYGCIGNFAEQQCTQAKVHWVNGNKQTLGTIGGSIAGAIAIIIGIAIGIFIFKRRKNIKEKINSKEEAIRFSEIDTHVREADLHDSAPVYAMPDKSKVKKEPTKPHSVNNPNYQNPPVAKKQAGTEVSGAVYENAVIRDDAKESSTTVSYTIPSLEGFEFELEDPNENSVTSSKALVIDSGSHVTESDMGGTYYYTAELLKRKIPLDKLSDFVDKKTRECFEEEFKLLPEGLIKPYTESQKRDNITKNRYRGIFPYDDTRVVLRNGESDYINASYIDGFKKLKAYIASLGPTYKYMDDMSAFWRMVWQEKCGKIIMLTNLMEAGTRKCDQYWPEKDFSQLYADINVTCLSEEQYADYTVRVFNIQKDSAKRTVTQVHFTAWPDQGVPDDVTCLIEFRQRVVSVKTNLDGPILVHCSAGIGRTGTYIALDSLTKEGESEGSVDIYACVRNMREQRVNMIQTAEQYEYLHKAVVHSLTFDSHAIGLNHFQQYMKSHDIKILAQKFQDLEHSVEKRSKNENEAIKKNSEIKEKNRVGADIPGDRNRPRLYLNLKPGASDYINALNVNGYRHVNRFILAQTPLPGTVDDFLTLVVQEKCSCIVNVEQETNKSKDVGIYYPADNRTLNRGPFTVRSEKGTSTQNFTNRRLTISNHGKARTEDHIVQHFQLTSWVDGLKCPDDAASFLDFLHHVELKSGGAEAGPILVHCLSGAEKCGLFCVVSILLEKVQCDQEVSVVNTVRQVKSKRHRVIPNKEQYIFCHQCVNEYIRSFDNYSNFASRQ